MNVVVARIVRSLLGDRPRALRWLLAPTGFAVIVDLLLRGWQLAGFALQGKAIYASSLLVGAAFWALPLWAAARLWDASSLSKRVGGWILLGLWVMPFATFSFAGQLIYYRVFHAFMGRNTLRLGIALRGTVRGWFDAWGGPWLLVVMVATGVVLTGAAMWAARRAMTPARSRTPPLLLVLTFAGALITFWVDGVDSRFLQAATPDVCFAHGVVHTVRLAVTGHWKRRQGMSLRTPETLPPLASTRSNRRDVLVILTESVRADVTCSDPSPGCRSPFLDEVASDRIPLGKLTTQTPNTFSSCMILWTGLGPDADLHAAHTAPVLWELARAAGYRTAYVSSQNPRYEDFGAFTKNAGIDVLVAGTDVGDVGEEQLGAPDERAIDAMLRFVHDVPEGMPYFAVLHLSNTHAPYRVDPSLLPFVPQSADPLGDVEAFHNRYRDSVRLQERTVAGLLRELRASRRWADTAVVFLSDHGEQFREHDNLYHNHSLFDEELRIPGWIAAGANALSVRDRWSLASYGGSRTYTQDVHETVVDLLGLEEARGTLPFAKEVTGRSLLRPRRRTVPAVVLSTSTAVWESDEPLFGAMRGERVVVGAPTGPWACFDLAADPSEQAPQTSDACPDLLPIARRASAGSADP